MDLEKKVQQWIAEQRQIFIDRNSKENGKDAAKKVIFLRMNDDGTSTVLVDGVEKRVRITGDSYLTKGEPVLLDEIKTGEGKRKRRRKPTKQAKKVKVKKQVGKRVIIEEEEEVSGGAFFGYVSYVNRKSDLDFHVLRLHDFQSSFGNISTFAYWDTHAGIGLHPYISDLGIGIGNQTLTHDGTLFVGGTYNSVSELYTAQFDLTDYSITDLLTCYTSLVQNNSTFLYSSYDNALFQDLKQRAALEAIEEGELVPFVDFLNSAIKVDYAPTLINLHTGQINKSKEYDSSRDMFLTEGGIEDHISIGSNIVIATSMDWLYSVEGWPHAPNYFPGISEMIYSYTCGVVSDSEVKTYSNSTGTDEVFPDSYLAQSKTYVNDWYVYCVDSSSQIKGCSPSDPSTTPCGPCQCGTSFFGCNYYTFYYIGCDGEVTCEPHDICGIGGGYQTGPNDPYVESESGSNIERQLAPIRRTDADFSNGFYPTPVLSYQQIAESIKDYRDGVDYTNRKIATMRDSLISTLRRAIDAGYFVLLDFDATFFLAWSRELDDFYHRKLLPIYEDQKGGVTYDQTVMSFLDALDLEVFVHNGTRDAYANANYPSSANNFESNAVKQESDYLLASYNLMFEKIYAQCGPVLTDQNDINSLNPVMDQVKVFYCFTSAYGELQDKMYATTSAEYRPQVYTASSVSRRTAPLTQGNSRIGFSTSLSDRTLADSLRGYITESRNWFISTSTAVGLVGKPETQADKYYYCLFVIMCGLFGAEQVIYGDLDSEILNFQ